MAEIAKSHQVDQAWSLVMDEVDTRMQDLQAHPARTVVLLPYAQLMPQARLAWQAPSRRPQPDGQPAWRRLFVPRFESTLNWAATAAPWSPGPEDLSFDRARDLPAAAWLLERAGLGAQRQALAGMLVDTAWQLAGVAAARPAAQRAAWADGVRPALAALGDSGALAFESAVQRIGLEWAAASAYASDILWTQDIDALLVLRGLQDDPLAEALQRHYGGRAASLSWPGGGATGEIHWQAAVDAEEEAARAAACVLAHVQAGRQPVALVAQDRTLTRRVRAMLGARGLAIRDETGWKLSTTRAAAQLMALWRASAWDAGSDAVLDWLKSAPAFSAAEVSRLESELRRRAQRDWPGLRLDDPDCLPTLRRAEAIRQGLQAARPLADWLAALREALQLAGQWDGLDADAAGAAVLDALCLREGMAGGLTRWTRRLSAADALAWVHQCLEAASFRPEHPAQPDLLILPLSQLLGRPLAAVVLPGCDENNLPAAPEPEGLWTGLQREQLGLPARAELQAWQRAAWQQALQVPRVDLLWRSGERGERLAPSALVQELLLDPSAAAAAPDPRLLRSVRRQPFAEPAPSGQTLLLQRLSASAYEDLRNCPYRFFALRLLRLQESPELQAEPGKREFGNWLHETLKLFHERLHVEGVADLAGRCSLLDACAREAQARSGIDQAGMVPLQAAWPALRDGYLQWLTGHEQQGWRFETAESARELALGPVQLVGKIDRIDRRDDGRRLVLDYKTESSQRTRDRIKQAAEDTQLAFYAALLNDDELEAAYLNLSEKEGSKAHEQADIVALRDALVQGIREDWQAIGQGAPLRALGEGSACDWCAARGLCRRDERDGADAAEPAS